MAGKQEETQVTQGEQNFFMKPEQWTGFQGAVTRQAHAGGH